MSLEATTAAGVSTPLLATSSMLSRRVRPETSRRDLGLLPQSKGLKTDAEFRVFLQHSLVYSRNMGFADPNLTQELEQAFNNLSQEEINHLQVEFDTNMEHDGVVTHPSKTVQRIAQIAFKYDLFLRNLKQVEQEQELIAQEETALLKSLPSKHTLQSNGLPTDMVEHLMEKGMEGHLEVVKNILLGSEEALGVTVTFQDLTVTQKRQPQFGCRKPKKSIDSEPVEILKHLSGVITPGKITLLLGAPHSGKTQLLHALAKQTKSKGPVKVTGSLHYNSHSAAKVYSSNFCTVAEQTDIHIPILTVRETLQFAQQCRGRPEGEDVEVRKLHRSVLNNRVDLIMAVLGLTRVADTVVGNENVKGISGGEMRRLTLGEMLVAGAKVLLLDEVSTGLDSAATFDITKSIRAMCKVMNINAIISLLQPPPETFELFQDLILMADGNIVYHGETSKALMHFTSLGRHMEREMDVADFLIEVSLDRTEELIVAYHKTPEYVHAVQCDPTVLYCTKEVENPQAFALEQYLVRAGRYHHSFPKLLQVVSARQFAVMARNVPFAVVRIIQNIVMGVVLGAMFYQMAFEQYYLVAMVLTQVLSFTGFASMGLLGEVLQTRDVYYKQSRQSFFPAASFVLADYVVGLPYSLADAMILGTISYFMSGLSISNHGQPYFVFLVIFISFGVALGTITRFFGYVAPDETTAFGIAVLVNVLSIVFGGAVATPSVIPGWWIWFYWAFSPIAWAYRSLLQNEYLSDDYQARCDDITKCPNNLQGQCWWYCGGQSCPEPFPSQSCGDYFLIARQVETDPMYLWLGAGLQWIYTLLAIAGSIWALIYVRYDNHRVDLNEMHPLEKLREEQEAKRKLKAEDEMKDLENQTTLVSPESAQYVIKESPALVWRNLFYTIELNVMDDDTQQKRRQDVDLLKGIDGFAKPYELTALMGSSGAGKTTLLDCLCYRKTMGKIKGEIMVDGVQVSPKSFQKDVGYVEQFGIHNHLATVRESLVFSAQLRLSNDTPEKERADIVEHVIKLLEIEPIANTYAGGLSFEENKRLTIAVELCANARYLFADEPTSGLTSKEAMITMQALKKVSQIGVPVICTIHQPSAEIFKKFDRLLLLKRGGEVVYFGPTQDLVKYFEAVPGVGSIPNGLNPASWMLDVIGAGVGRTTANSAFDFAEMYRLSDVRKSSAEELEAILNHSGGGGEEVIGEGEKAVKIKRHRSLRFRELTLVPKAYNRSYLHQLKLLVKRDSQEMWRSVTYTHVRWITILVFGFVCGTLFLQQDLSTAAGIQSRVNVINLMLLLTANYNATIAVPFVFGRRALFYRERASGMYAGFIYAISHQIAEEPHVFWEVLVSTCVFYFAVGMTATADAFFYYLFLMHFFVMLVTFIGATFAAMFSILGAATLVSSFLLQLTILFSGVAVPGNLLQDWLLGGYYLSIARWSIEGLIVSQFLTYEDVICNPSSTVTWWPEAQGPNAGSCPSGSANFLLGDVNKFACCSQTGNRPISAKAYVLNGWTYEDGFYTPAWMGGNNGFRSDWLGYDYLFIVVAMILFRISYTLLMHYVSHQKR
ncbi:hypothetical protein BASA81_006452 [Batrachochytrium salamandrivorans]|nr:hypothetical protein BASA81_006452 [Batrachochytrium salamandrivorans]